jgi:DNA-binding MarR family transcriptional regulator
MSANATAISPTTSERDGIVERSLTARWHHESFFDRGFVAVPVRFLELYAHLEPHPLSPGEALFVLELMSFKWSAADPFPSYKRIAERMNVSDKMVRRYAQSLETKKYLRRQIRKNQTNLFDLTGLFKAVLKAIEMSNDEARKADEEVKEAKKRFLAKVKGAGRYA